MNPDRQQPASRKPWRVDIIFIVLFAVLILFFALWPTVASVISPNDMGSWVDLRWLVLLGGIPAVSLAWSITALVLFCRTPRGSDMRRARLHGLIRAATVFGIIATTYISFGILLMIAIRNM